MLILVVWPFQSGFDVSLALPMSVGWNVYVMWHCCPGASCTPEQSSVRPYGASMSRPVPDIRIGVGLTFVTVTTWAGADFPARTGPKLILAGDTLKVGTTPVPDSL